MRNELLANEKFLDQILKMSRFWFWTDEKVAYAIEDGKFIANTKREYDLLARITTKNYHNKIRLKSN